MIKANFNTYASYVTDSLYQWDINQVLAVSGLNLSVNPEVHFSNASMDKAIVRQATRKNNVVTVNIPNSLLQQALKIHAHIGIYEGDTFKIVERVEIPVIPRTRPSDYVFEDTDGEIYSYNRLENMINNIDETWRNFADEAIQTEVIAWLEANPEATTTVQDGALTETKFSDELKLYTIKDYVTPQMFGAKGDGVTDDTEAIRNAVSYCILNSKKLFFPYGTYVISDTLDMRYIDIDSMGIIKITHSGIGMIVGDKSSEVIPRTIRLANVVHSNYVDDDISIRIVGLMNGDINIGKAVKVQLYANGDSDYSAIAYSNFHIGKCDYLELTDNEDAFDIGWINENAFYNCRVLKGFTLKGNTYPHNNNVFYKPCFEGALTQLSNCTRNIFYDFRNESIVGIELDDKTSFNYISLNHFYHDYFNKLSDEKITDNGRHNTITYAGANALKSVGFYNINAQSVIKNLYEISDVDAISVNDDIITVIGSWKWLIKDVIIPVNGIKFLTARADAGAFRFFVQPLDENKEVILTEPCVLKGVGSTPLQADGTYTSGLDAWGMWLAINDPTVKYVKLSVCVGSGASEFTFKQLCMEAHYEIHDTRTARLLEDYFKTAIPTN